MPLPFFCFSCSPSHAATDDNFIIRVAGDSTHLTPSTSTSASSSSSSLPTTSSSDSVSLQTFPSLPSLHSLLPSQNTPPLSASFSCIHSLSTPDSSFAALAATPHLLFSASESSVAVFDLTDHRILHHSRRPSSSGAIKSLALSPSFSTLFSAHQDSKIRAWKFKPPNLRLLSSLPTPSDRLRRLPFPSNYIPVRRHKTLLWIQHADAVSAVAVRRHLLYSVSWDKTLKIWRASDFRCLESLTAHDDAVNAVAVGSDGTVYTGSADRRIRVWAVGPGERKHSLVATLEKHRSAVNALAINDDGSVLYSGACDRSILVWEREDSANFMVVAGALRGHGKAILCLSTVDDLIFSGSTDRTVRIWRRDREGRGYSCLAVMEGHVRGVRSLVAVRIRVHEEEEEEYRICSGSLDGEIRIWRVRVSDKKCK